MGRTAPLYVVFALFAIAYAVLTPPGEAPDELPHLQYADWLLHERSLPDRRFDQVYQDHHPPLYHGSAAVVLGLAQHVDRPAQLRLPGPFAIDLPLADPMLDRAALERGAASVPAALRAELAAKANLKPRHDRITRLHLILVRLWSVVLAIATLALVHATARELFGDRGRVTLAVAFAALLPQFAFIGAVINCDIMAALTGNLVLWLCVRTLVHGTTASWRVGLALGGAAGLALLAKMSGIAVAVPIAATYVLAARAIGVRALLVPAALTAVVALAVGGWWYAINAARYGDPFMVAVQAETMGEQIHQPPIGIAFLAAYFHDTIRSFFGVLGPLRIPMADAAFAIHVAIVGLAIAGAFVARPRTPTSRRPGTRDAAIVLALGLAATWAVVFRGNLTFYSFQGRYLLPALATIAIGVAAGLDRALRPGPIARTAIVLVWFAIGLQLFWGRYLPEYYPRRDRADGPRVVYYDDLGRALLAPRLVEGAAGIADGGDPTDPLATVARGERVALTYGDLPLGEPLVARIALGEAGVDMPPARVVVAGRTVVAATATPPRPTDVVVAIPVLPDGSPTTLAIETTVPGRPIAVGDVRIDRTRLVLEGLAVPRDLPGGGETRAVIRFRNRDPDAPARGRVAFRLLRDGLVDAPIGDATVDVPPGDSVAHEATLAIPWGLSAGPATVVARWTPVPTTPLIDVSPCSAKVSVGRIDSDPRGVLGRSLYAADPVDGLTLDASVPLPPVPSGRYRVALAGDVDRVRVRWALDGIGYAIGSATLDAAWPGGAGMLDLLVDERGGGPVRIDRITVTAVGDDPHCWIPVPHESACHVR